MFKGPRGLAVASFAISLLTLSATIVPEIAMAQSDKPAIRPDVEAFLKMFLIRRFLALNHHQDSKMLCLI